MVDIVRAWQKANRRGKQVRDAHACRGGGTDCRGRWSRAISASDGLFDLDPIHSAQSPTLRRIKNPADNDKSHSIEQAKSKGADIMDAFASDVSARAKLGGV